MNDLATLLRDDVAASEPSTTLDAMVPVRLGRRRLRTRRVASMGAALVVLGVGAAVAVPHLRSDDRRGVSVVGDSSHELEELLVARARPVLERSAELGPESFHAENRHGFTLQPGSYDRASYASLSYGDDQHSVSVQLVDRGTESSLIFLGLCTDQVLSVDSPEALPCTAQDTAEGQVVDRYDFGTGYSGFVATTMQGPPQPPTYVTHEVVLVIDGGHRAVIASETVAAYSWATAHDQFEVPTDDLREIAEDPALDITLPTG